MEVTLDGHVTRMRGLLLDDPEVVAPLYARAYLTVFCVKRAQRMLGLKIHTAGTPATEALAEAALALPPERYPAHRQQPHPYLHQQGSQPLQAGEWWWRYKARNLAAMVSLLARALAALVLSKLQDPPVKGPRPRWRPETLA